MLTKRIIVFCQLVVIAITLGLIPPTVNAGKHSKPTHRILKSASELDYPPFALVRKDGSADGFSVDLLKAVTKAMGMEVNIVVGPWHEIKQKLEERHLDVLPLVAYAQERDKMFDFTVPYLRMHGTIFVREGEKSIRSKADLKDKEVMVMRSDAAHEYVVTENLSKKLVLTESFEEAMKLLSEGKHDAVVVQQLVGLQLIKKLGISNVVDVSDFQETNLRPFGKPLPGFEQKFCFAVQEGDGELLALLNEGLAIVSANGTYEELYKKWFSPILPQPPIPFTLILKYLFFILGPILFFMAIFGLWYLKREVVKKTQSLLEEIKERKQAEETLRENEERFRSVFENSGVGMALVDQNGKYKKANQALTKFLGYNEQELLSMTVQDTYFPDEPGQDSDLARQLWSGKVNDVNFEKRYIHKDGQVVWGDITLSSIRDAEGKILYVAGQIQVITDRKKAEEELRESEEKYRQLFESEKDAIMVFDAETLLYEEVNRACLDLYGYTKDEFFRLTPMHISAQNEETEEALKDIVQGKGSERISLRYQKKKDGTVFPVEITSGVIEIKGRKKIIGAVRDISERIEMDQKREKLETQLKQSQKMESIGTLAGGIAHDINNLLSPIMIHSEMAMMDLPPDNPILFNLKEIFQAGERAREMVKQILAFSRQKEHEKTPVKMSAILTEVIKLLRPSIPTTIDIRQNIEAEVDTVFADPTQIQQVLLNLCTNASHAMREKGGVLEIKLEDLHLDSGDISQFTNLNPGFYIRLTISDTGQGIDPEVMNRIFEPYFTTKGLGEGTGMGLAAAHGIVISHGGDITVESEPGRGTIFRVLFPKFEGEITEDAKGIVQLPKGTERILIVDDEKAAVDAIKPMLENLDYKVTARTSSIEALEAFRNNPEGFDLVITDMTMPNMTGKDLAKELMAIHPVIPIILCTGFSEQIDEKKAEEMGIRAFVMKPIVMREIADTIRQVLDKK